MSKKLKLCSGQEAVHKFQRAGWSIARQKGSHLMMTKPDFEYTISIPLHNELGIGILRKLIKLAGISIEQFNNL
jgi:predicted RNA binding protein YcfA (HicA-like mRNA interferase family)